MLKHRFGQKTALLDRLPTILILYGLAIYFNVQKCTEYIIRLGVTKNNCGDIVWWDMLFGAYENPKEWVHTCGFTPEREERLIDMLGYKDVHKKI